MNKQAQRFIVTCAIACVALGSFAILFIRLMDPFLIFDAPRIAGVNAHKPTTLHQEHLVKAYDMIRVAPAAVILGSSRIDIGFATQESLRSYDGSVIYNAGFLGGSPYVAYRYLQHATSRRHLSLVLLGLDFEQFLAAEGDNTRDTKWLEPYLSTAPDGWLHPYGRWQRTLTLDGLVASFATFRSNIRGESGAGFVSNGNFRFDAPWDSNTNRDAYPRAAWQYVSFTRHFINRGRARLDSAVLSDVQAILDHCASEDVEVILFINPIHADLLELYDLAGYWNDFESWKRELTSLTANHNRSHGSEPVALWDFSDYHIYATEAVSLGQRPRWFQELSHYSPELGVLILRRLFGMDRGGFGAILLPETLDPHLASIREQRRLYRERHVQDAQRARAWYNSTVHHTQLTKRE